MPSSIRRVLREFGKCRVQIGVNGARYMPVAEPFHRVRTAACIHDYNIVIVLYLVRRYKG
jgi:hypothetical protein